jgi:hypothetical protein
MQLCKPLSGKKQDSVLVWVFGADLLVWVF